mmetsp:Transcript_69619/g.136877  ORF Transcript_69619/g.136877 Transcript_69619/m.136877 type:complete len:206 (+) Transcript_69619:25-642(+)
MADDKAEDAAATPAAPSEPTPAEKAELAMIKRVTMTMDCFTNEEGGMPAVPVEEVGHVIRACGCFVPELVLVDQILPSIVEDEYAELNIVRPELLKKRIIAMLKERTWVADTEHEMLLAFRRLDQLSHNGEEYGFIESEKMGKYLTSQGLAPFRKEENEAFLSIANDGTGSKVFYHDYIGKLIPLLEDDDFLFGGPGRSGYSTRK